MSDSARGSSPSGLLLPRPNHTAPSHATTGTTAGTVRENTKKKTIWTAELITILDLHYEEWLKLPHHMSEQKEMIRRVSTQIIESEHWKQTTNVEKVRSHSLYSIYLLIVDEH